MKKPEFGESLEPFRKSDDAVELLWFRRSTAADFLGEPGPDAEVLEKILTIGARAPDHRRVTPFRFLLFRGDSRKRFGEDLAKAYARAEPDASPDMLEKQRQRFTRAPIVVGVISSIDPAHRTPEWEQVLTVGAVCQNILVACSALGFAAQWLTEWYAYDDNIKRILELDENERVAGFIYIGTATVPPKERARPTLDDIVSDY